MKTIIISKKVTILIISIILLLFFILYCHISIKKNEIAKVKDDILIVNDCDCEDTEKIQYEEFLKEKYNEKKLIALTFDDGPSKYTELLVNELSKRDVKATFFILGENAINRQDTLKIIYDAGNEIGIHSYKHKLFTKLKDDEIVEQISTTKDIIYNSINTTPTLMRVPYGSINSRVSSVLKKEKLNNVLWSVDSKDWKFKNATKTYNYVMKNVKGNDIILMHDIFKPSVDAALRIIDKLQSDCYVFVTVSELENIKNSVKSNKTD